jgi:hypothetical protein
MFASFMGRKRSRFLSSVFICVYLRLKKRHDRALSPGDKSV